MTGQRKKSREQPDVMDYGDMLDIKANVVASSASSVTSGTSLSVRARNQSVGSETIPAVTTQTVTLIYPMRRTVAWTARAK